MNESIYPGLVIEQISVTPRPDDQVSQPIDDVLDPGEVKLARPM